jgi:hypothetical protein
MKPSARAGRRFGSQPHRTSPDATATRNAKSTVSITRVHAHGSAITWRTVIGAESPLNWQLTGRPPDPASGHRLPGSLSGGTAADPPEAAGGEITVTGERVQPMSRPFTVSVTSMLPRGQRRWQAGDPRVRCHQRRGRRGVAGVLPRPGRPGPIRGGAGHLRRPPRPGRRDRRHRARRVLAAMPATCVTC